MPPKQFHAVTMCVACERTLHFRWILIREWEHRWLHERGVCGCKADFPGLLNKPRMSGTATSHKARGKQPEGAVPQLPAPVSEGMVDGTPHVAIRIPSLLATEWVEDHKDLHQSGKCNCPLSFNYKPLTTEDEMTPVEKAALRSYRELDFGRQTMTPQEIGRRIAEINHLFGPFMVPPGPRDPPPRKRREHAHYLYNAGLRRAPNNKAVNFQDPPRPMVRFAAQFAHPHPVATHSSGPAYVQQGVSPDMVPIKNHPLNPIGANFETPHVPPNSPTLPTAPPPSPTTTPPPEPTVQRNAGFFPDPAILFASGTLATTGLAPPIIYGPNHFTSSGLTYGAPMLPLAPYNNPPRPYRPPTPYPRYAVSPENDTPAGSQTNTPTISPAISPRVFPVNSPRVSSVPTRTASTPPRVDSNYTPLCGYPVGAGPEGEFGAADWNLCRLNGDRGMEVPVMGSPPPPSHWSL
ncbi:hypothetical protein OQA88_3762 [Cercophora sp. LCS_1]